MPRDGGDWWLKGPVRFKRRSDYFYAGLRGVRQGLVPRKATNNFYTPAGSYENGTIMMGLGSHNFVTTKVR